MANQMMCKGCEDSEEPEYGIYLISDLQNIGVLPFAIGRNCLPEWLAFMMETYGMPAVEEVTLEPSESDEEPPDEPQTLEEAQALLRAENAPQDVSGDPERPTPIRSKSGRSRQGSSARTGAKDDDTEGPPTEQRSPAVS